MKRARMMGRIVGGVLIGPRHGKQRRCFCIECLHARATRPREKRQWRKEAEVER